MSTVFRVILEGEQEVPPRDTTASGVGTVIFDSAEIAASYSFDVQGIVVGRRRLRRETHSQANPDGVTITDFADELGSATPGTAVPLYFNVHSNDFPGGEIRGQLKTTTILLLHLIPMAPGR